MNKPAKFEHVHEWVIHLECEEPIELEYVEMYAECHCYERLTWGEIQLRINATERLSAKKDIALGLKADHYYVSEELEAYIAALSVSI